MIENLNDLDADIIFIKNIDNVVPDKLKGDTVLYKKLIAGVLVALQQRAFAYLQLLDSGKYTHEQILEVLQFLQKQLYCKNPETKNLEDAELVIYLKEFNLVKYVDKATGFISYKSKNGKDLKALELPGLWNGAMSDWNTVFVEVPLTTFNPVKTVNDLLREQHQ